MLTSLSEFKFFQSFRMPIEESDQVRFLVEIENEMDKFEYIDDAKLLDVSTSGLGFSSSARLSVDQNLRISIQYKKIIIDVDGKIVRSFGSGEDINIITYGVELEEDNTMKRFLQKFIVGLHPERLRDCLVQLSLTDRYSRSSEGIEMFSLLISIFKDITKFGSNDEFLTAMLEEVSRILNSQRASLFLINPDTNELQAVCALGCDKDELKFDYRQGIAGSVFTTGVSLNIDTIRDETRFSDKVDKETGFVTKSIICNPIYNRDDKVIGVIEALNKRNENRFTIEDEKVMKVLSLVFSSVFHTYNPVSDSSMIRRFSTPFDREFAIIGNSSSTLSLRKAIVKLKDIDIPMLIQGERGVGKILFSTIIHNEGKRGLNELHIIDCQAYNDTEFSNKVFEAEGVFEKVKGGTIVFKDIDKLSFETQKKLVFNLNRGGVPGSDLTFDFRIIATSVTDLETAVSENSFNSELFDYLSKGFIEIPPLRDHMDDIDSLVNYMLKMECRKQGLLLKAFSEKIMNDLKQYEWPGNISELKTYVERAITLNPRAHIITEINDLSIPKLKKNLRGLRVFDDIPYAADSSLNLKDRIALIERQIIETEIKRLKGNKSKAAKAMGISREALRKKLIQSEQISNKLSGKVSLVEDEKKAA